MKLWRVLGVLGVLAAAGLIVAASSPAIRTRVQLVGLKLTGQLPDVPLRDLPWLMRPRSGFDMYALRETESGAATLLLPPEMAYDTMPGSLLFSRKCSQCHGTRGEGSVGPSLVSGEPRHGASDWATYQVLRHGIPQTAMQPTGLSFTEAWQVIAVLRARQRGLTRGTPPMAQVRDRPVEDSDLAQADSKEDEWLSWSGGWSGRRNRIAPDLTAETMNRLRLSWAYKLPPDPEVSQSAPIVVGKILIITSAEDVIALNSESGEVIWRFHHAPRHPVLLCCQRSNRGVAVYGRLVFVGTLDGRLIALNLDNGNQVWEAEVGDPRAGVSITGAPLAAGGKVIVGVGGGEFGLRGYLDAYDPSTGKRLWRFHTIPQPGETGGDSWPTGGLARGGGGTWATGAYDPERQLLYWGTGNPAPVFAPELRQGDNLYTCSVLALDINTGALKWSYQFTPNDSHDWDSAQTPVLVDHSWKGQVRPLMLWANRNGFVYVLDRETGEFLNATAFVRQNWNQGFDSAGRPILAASTAPTPGGTLVYPSASSAANWRPASYSNRLGLMFLAATEKGGLYVRNHGLDDENSGHLGGFAVPLEGANSILAMEIESGKIRWRFAAPRSDESNLGGLLSVGDQLVIGGVGTQLFAVDARTGEQVWSLRLGARIAAAPVLYRIRGQIRLAITAGSVLYVFEPMPIASPPTP